MMKSPYILISFCILLSLSTGCSKTDKKIKYAENPLTEAQNKLIEIAKTDYDTDIVTKSFENTMWIYIPLKERILDLKAVGQGASKKESSDDPIGINFLQGQYIDYNFDIAYDIGRTKKYDVSYGYTTAYPPKIQSLQRSMLTAIFRAYGEAREDPNNPLVNVLPMPGERENPDPEQERRDQALIDAHFNREEVPQFFVIIIADIDKGLDIKMTVAFTDLKRVMSDPSFTEEYSRRALYETPAGNIDIINDKAGNYIDYTPITWEKFIADQIAYRVQFIFQQSKKKAPEDIQSAILTAANSSVSAYDFDNFDSVILRDLNKEMQLSFSKTVLKDYELVPEGKLHVIKFR